MVHQRTYDNEIHQKMSENVMHGDCGSELSPNPLFKLHPPQIFIFIHLPFLQYDRYINLSHSPGCVGLNPRHLQDLANTLLECHGNLFCIHFLTVESCRHGFEDFTYGLCRYDFWRRITFRTITENLETEKVSLSSKHHMAEYKMRL